MLGRGIQKIVVFIDSKGGMFQKVASFFLIILQTFALLFNLSDFVANPVYIILGAVSIYIILIFCFVSVIIRKNDSPSEIPLPNTSVEKNSIYFHPKWYRFLSVFLILISTVLLLLMCSKYLPKKQEPLIINDENICNTAILEKSWYNAGAFVTVKEKDTSYDIKAAKIISNESLCNLFKKLDCAIDISITPSDSTKILLLNSIKLIQDSYAPLPSYSGDVSQISGIKEDSVIILTLPGPSEKADIKDPKLNIIINDNVRNFQPLRIMKGETKRLLLRVNAKKPGVYSFKIKLGLIADNKPECEMYPVESSLWLFIK